VPGNVIPLVNQRKHLTDPERAARLEAEQETMPQRDTVTLVPPKYLTRDRTALEYWKKTIERMNGISLLDDLDAEMLAVYCTMLSRRDAMNALCRKATSEIRKAKTTEDKLEVMGKLDSLMGKLQKQEQNILQYADKLGLTPSGRVRLARKRAEARLVEDSDDLFGD